MGRETKDLTLPSGKTAKIVKEFNYGESNILQKATLFGEKADDSVSTGEAPKMETEGMIAMLKVMKENKVEVHAKALELGVKELEGKPCKIEDINNLSVKDANFLYAEVSKLIDNEEKKN